MTFSRAFKVEVTIPDEYLIRMLIDQGVLDGDVEDYSVEAAYSEYEETTIVLEEAD